MLLASCLALGFALQSGDRVVFYGDSITEQGHFTSYVEAFVTTRYPNLKVKFYNRGWSGDISWGGPGGTIEDRVKLDVSPIKPTHVFVMLGMNDGGYVPYDMKVESAIQEWYGKLLNLLQKSGPGVNMTLARTSPWDDFAHEYASKGKPPEPWAPWQGYNDALLKYGLIAKQEAEKRKGIFVDFNEPLSDIVKRAFKVEKDLAKEIIPDGIHPSDAGGLVMTCELMKAWNADALVSEVELNAKTGVVRQSKKASVSDVNSLANQIEFSWTQTDICLPFAFDDSDKTVNLVNKLGKFSEQFNRQTIRVLGLEPGSYELSIDSQKIGIFPTQLWEKGLDLGEFETPMKKQAREVLGLCRNRNETDFIAWRKLGRELPATTSTKQAIAKVESLVEEQNQAIQLKARPKSHTFRLIRK